MIPLRFIFENSLIKAFTLWIYGGRGSLLILEATVGVDLIVPDISLMIILSWMSSLAIRMRSIQLLNRPVQELRIVIYELMHLKMYCRVFVLYYFWSWAELDCSIFNAIFEWECTYDPILCIESPLKAMLSCTLARLLLRWKQVASILLVLGFNLQLWK